MKKIISSWLAICMLAIPAAAVSGAPNVEADSVVLIEQETGALLYEENAHAPKTADGITKIMTLLLAMEAVDEGHLTMNTMITVSSHAAGMGGLQVYLKEGEQISVHDLIKSVAMTSGNDAAVALSEAVSGSESAFVTRMNEKASELGLEDTTFQNCTGLSTDGNITSAYDVAMISRELLSHEGIKAYAATWIDSLRDGEFQLANTNKLVRFYEGTTGLHTGYVATEGYCISASAERDGMELIAVVFGAPNADARYETAKSLLNFGFANYTMVDVKPDRALAPVDVILGEQEELQPHFAESARILMEKTQKDGLTQTWEIQSQVEAPVQQGQVLGKWSIFASDGTMIKEISIVAPEEVPRLTMGGLFSRLLQILLMKTQ